MFKLFLTFLKLNYNLEQFRTPAFIMPIKGNTDIYLGRENLKKLIKSPPFKTFMMLKGDSVTHPKNELWWILAGRTIRSILNIPQVQLEIEELDLIKQANPTDINLQEKESKAQQQEKEENEHKKLKKIFQNSKCCDSAMAAEILLLVREYYSEDGKEWFKNEATDVVNTPIFRKYFYHHLDAPKEPELPTKELEGSWAMYSHSEGLISRSWFQFNFHKNDFHYFPIPNTSDKTTCELDYVGGVNEITIKAKSIKQGWRIVVIGKLISLSGPSDYSVLKGMARLYKGQSSVHMPVLMVKRNDISIIRSQAHNNLWAEIKPNLNHILLYEEEGIVLTYYQMLVDGNSQFLNLTPPSPISEWLNIHLRKKGRHQFTPYKEILLSQDWVSLARKPGNDDEDFRIYHWSFQFHEFRQAIYATRKRGKSTEDPEAHFNGEMKYFNNRFWIDFSSEERHKILFMRANPDRIKEDLCFMAMGSSTFFEEQPYDLGDMLTEILLPKSLLPKALQQRHNLNYAALKTIVGIPTDFKLYLNHRDHNILSFENPVSIQSKLRKQRKAITFEGDYMVYTYNRFGSKNKRLYRYEMHIDSLALTTFKKVLQSSRRAYQEFKGLAEATDQNLHIILEYEPKGMPLETEIPEEVQLMVDSSPHDDDTSLFTGVMADTDSKSNPRSMACVMIRIDQNLKNGPLPELNLQLKEVVSNNSNAFCEQDGKEYMLLNELLWKRRHQSFSKRFEQHLPQPLSEQNFLEVYFEIIGGVFHQP